MRLLAFFASSLVLSACGARTGLDFVLPAEDAALPAASASDDAGRDAADDAGRDAANDAGRDAADDAGRDAANDAGRDAADDAGRDASVPPDDAAPPPDDAGGDAGPCDYGTIVGNVFGQVTYFAGGAALPAGAYQLTYVDGCMMYTNSGAQGWTVNAFTQTSGTDEWYVVGGSGTPGDYPEPPGTVGDLVGQGAYADFDACVTASLVYPPVTLDSPGGPIGLWLSDNPYGDNVAGIDGRNPTWRLTCVE